MRKREGDKWENILLFLSFDFLPTHTHTQTRISVSLGTSDSGILCEIVARQV